MNGWILTTKEALGKLPIPAEKAEDYGLKVVLVGDVEIVISNNIDGTIRVAGVDMPLPDFVLNAAFQKDLYKPTTLIHQLETLGVLCINNSRSIGISRDKIYTSQILAAQGIPVATTLYCNKNSIDYDFVESMFSYPVVVKIVDGTQGKGVHLAEDRAAIEAVFESENVNDVIIQEYISASFGRDIRVATFRGKVVRAVLRESAGIDFRSNVSLGGHATIIEPNEKIISLAQKIYDVTKIDLCGVDLLLNGDDYIVCELNSMPGGLEPDQTSNPLLEIFKEIALIVSKMPLARWKVENIYKKAEQEPLHEVLSSLKPIDKVKMIKDSMPKEVARVQQLVLQSILNRANNSLYAKEHSFDRISDVSSYQKSQPITSWDDYTPYVDMMIDNQSNVLFNGATESFVNTSGTTAAPKNIPESKLGKSSKGFVSKAKFEMLASLMPSFIKSGSILPIIVLSKSTTNSGITCSTASSLAIGQLSKELIQRIVFPIEIMKVQDIELFSYLCMLYAISCDDLALVVGNNALMMVKLIEIADLAKEMIISDITNGDISYPCNESDRAIVDSLKSKLTPNVKRGAELQAIVDAGKPFTPASYWGGLKVVSFWTSASVGYSICDLMPLLPSEVKVMDAGYGASELKINIPFEFGAKDGMLSIATAFYEFLPYNSTIQEPLLAHELTGGGEYELIITTYAGLYRYNMHDVVRCNGFVGGVPNIEFLHKSGDVGNICGEKLQGSALIKAISDLTNKIDLSVRRFQILADYQNRNYILYVECSEGKGRVRFTEEINGALCENTWVYRKFISNNLLKPIKVQFMKQGWQDELYRAKKEGGNINESQIKLPIFINKKPSDEWYE